MNKHLLVSDANHFSIQYEINPYMHEGDQPDTQKVIAQHEAIIQAHRDAGRTIEYLPSAPECPDMVYVANSSLTRGNKAVLSKFPPERQNETPHYRKWLQDNGWEVIEPPYLFSGQGDTLPLGNKVIMGAGWRTDPRMHDFIAEQLGYEVISVQTLSNDWYDLDLAVSILREDLIAFCPDAFDATSIERLKNIPGVDYILVDLDEAQKFGCNLVSDGATVVMGQEVPKLTAAIEAHGLKTILCATDQLAKGGGAIRCTSLALDNL
jgi:N-dimethylarginine dimethylaminohydrolase